VGKRRLGIVLAHTAEGGATIFQQGLQDGP
jgi:hypothetical protein